MRSPLTAAILFGIGLLLVQAIWLLRSEKARNVRLWTSLLTVGIAALIGLNLLLVSLHLVVTDLVEGCLLVQGSSRWLLRALLFGYAMVSAMVVQSAASARDESHRPYLLFLTGAAVGVGSACCIVEHQPTSLPEGTIYSYSLYVPYLLIWIVGCVVDWSLVVAGLRTRELRRWLSATASLGAAGLGSWLIARPEGPGTEQAALSAELSKHWRSAYWITLALAVLFLLRVLLSLLLPRFYKKHLHVRRGLLTAMLVALTVPAVLVRDDLAKQNVYLAAACCGLVLIAGAWVLRRAWIQDEVFIKGEGRLARYVMVLSLLTLLLLAVDLFFLKWTHELWNLLGTTVAAIVLVELADEGPLHAGVSAVLFGETSLVRRLGKQLQKLWAGLRALIEWVQSLPWLWSLMMKALFPALAFVAWQEIPNHGRTVVQSFDLYAADKADADAGKRFAEFVVHRLNGIALDLDENMLIALPAALQATAGDAHKPLEQAVVHTSDPAADVASDVIDLGPLGKIHMGKLLSVLQRPARALLRVRHIEGALVREGTGYRLVAHSSTGQSWTHPHRTEPPLDLSTLAEQLAFDILSTDADWMARGMTLDEDAFEAFLDATWSQTRLERLAGNHGSLDAAHETIANLRAAVAKDPGFAVAHYRLALALSNEGQYGGALDHLRAALNARPSFGPALDALARLFESGLHVDRPLLLRAMSPAPSADDAAQLVHLRTMARELWTRMIRPGSLAWSWRDQAAAHTGLCTLAVHDTGFALQRDGIFHCTAAARIYRSFADDAFDDQDQAALLAYAFNALAVLRTRTSSVVAESPPQRGGPDRGWGCSAGQFDGQSWTLQTQRSVEATQLFRKAHELRPRDTTIQCNLALAEQADGDSSRYEGLASDSETQLRVCNDLLVRGVETREARYMHAALDACERAMKSDRFDADALNLYAYTFRIWSSMADLSAIDPPTATVANKAEESARRAVQLSQHSSVEGYLGMMESTLGEVLLVRERPHEALVWLQKATLHVPDHVQYNEIFRDLAEALVCARQEDAAGGTRSQLAECADAHEKAENVLADIRAREALREANVYAAEPNALDRTWMEARCRKSNVSTAPVLRTVARYPAGRACGTNVLRVTPPRGVASAKIHFWGNGTDFTSDAQGFSHALARSETHGQLFVQLCDGNDTPLSEAFSLETRPGDGARCANRTGVVELRFLQNKPSATRIAAAP